MPYLICKNCGGYYHLDDDETPKNYDRCHCGGKLVYSENLDSKPPKSRKKLFIALTLILILTITAVSYLVFFIPHNSGLKVSTPTVIASDYRGTVSKQTITAANATSNSTNKTIAVITGMHPREKLSIRTVSDMVTQYNLTSDQAIIHYMVNVTDNPDNYVNGRSNGEGLVSQYIIPDVKNSSAEVVIICHDHAPGYGMGYYVATPKMDSPSVAVGELIENTLPEFTYYRSSSNAEHGSSTLTVSNPLAAAGFRTLVYEMPQWASYNQAYTESKKLVATCFQAI